MLTAQKVGKEVVEPPSAWIEAGIRSIEITNRNEDDGEILVRGPKGPLLRLHAEGMFVSCDQTIAPAICRRKLVRSSSATFVKIDQGGVALLVSSDDGRPGLGSIWMILLDSAQKPYVAFHLEAFELAAIERSADGVQIIGRKTLSEACCAENAATYDPYSVFTLSSSDKAVAKYSLSLSKAYNVRLYVWAGPDSREDVLVQTQQGKRRLIPNPQH